MGYSCPPSLFLTLLHFSHNQSKWYSPSFSNTTFHNFPCISDLLCEVSKFQHHRKLCTKGSIMLGSSSNLSQTCKRNDPSCWMPFLPWQFWMWNSRVRLALFFYHVTQMFEIFHIIQLFLFHHSRYWGWLPWDSPDLSFSTFIFTPLDLPFPISLSVMPFSKVSALDSSIKSSAYFTVRITYLRILKSPNPWRASLVWYTLYTLSKVGDKQQTYPIHFPVFILLFVQFMEFLIRRKREISLSLWKISYS